MKIRLKTEIRFGLDAPRATKPGEIVDVDKELAEGLILIGDAEAVED